MLRRLGAVSPSVVENGSEEYNKFRLSTIAMFWISKKAVGKIMESRSTCNPSDTCALSDSGGLVWLALKAASFFPAQLQLSLSPELVSAKHYITLAEMLQMSEGESVAHLLLGLGCLSSHSVLSCKCQRKAALGCGLSSSLLYCQFHHSWALRNWSSHDIPLWK